jgi:hypothetical protein
MSSCEGALFCSHAAYRNLDGPRTVLFNSWLPEAGGQRSTTPRDQCSVYYIVATQWSMGTKCVWPELHEKTRKRSQPHRSALSVKAGDLAGSHAMSKSQACGRLALLGSPILVHCVIGRRVGRRCVRISKADRRVLRPRVVFWLCSFES